MGTPAYIILGFVTLMALTFRIYAWYDEKKENKAPMVNL
jgi:hypothetical protein